MLLDAFLKLLSANEEAVSILCYPESPHNIKRLGHFLMRRITSLLLKQDSRLRRKFCNEFVSGKRHYQIQLFALKSPLENGHGPISAVLLARKGNKRPISQISQKFGLTQRETEALELLMDGCTTKQIATRMNISPNTAKAFLRSVMFKTGAGDRSGILAKILHVSTGAGA